MCGHRNTGDGAVSAVVLSDEAGTDSVGEDKLGGEDVANQDDYDQFLEQFAVSDEAEADHMVALAGPAEFRSRANGAPPRRFR